MAVGGPATDPDQSWAYGTHRGHEVLLGFTRERPSAQTNNVDIAAMQLFHHLTTKDMERFFCWVRMPSLLLGLEVGAPPEHPSNAMLTGQPNVDKKLSVRALAPLAVSPLFARAGDGGDALDLVLAAADSGAAIRIEDTFISIAMLRPREDAAWLSWAVDACVRIADRLARTRASMPALPWEEATAAAFDALARARAFQFDRTHLRVTGAHGQIQVEVSLTTSPPPYGDFGGKLGYAIEIVARYPALGTGLCVFPERGIPGLVKFFLKDAKLGDPRFDDAFIVQAENPAVLACLFTPEVRARLVAMVARSASLSLDDTHITMHLGPQTLDPASLGYAMDDVVGAAYALVQARIAGPASSTSRHSST